MPKKVSNSPSRQPRRAKKRTLAPAATSSPAPVRAAPPARAMGGSPRPAPARERTAGAAVVDYHYVINDLKRVGLTAAAMFAVLAVLAVFLR